MSRQSKTALRNQIASTRPLSSAARWMLRRLRSDLRRAQGRPVDRRAQQRASRKANRRNHD